MFRSTSQLMDGRKAVLQYVNSHIDGIERNFHIVGIFLDLSIQALNDIFMLLSVVAVYIF